MNQTIINVFALAGLFTVAHLLVVGCKNLFHYLKFKEFPKTLEEQTIAILESEKTRLLKNLESIEEENREITLMVLKRLE